MKTILKLIPIILIVITVSCGGSGADDPLPQTNIATTVDKLQGEWNLSSVTRDGLDVSSEYGGFKITISNTSYTITNGGLAWSEASGTLGINGGDNSTIIDSMGGNTNISIAFSNSDKTLTISVTVASTILTGGRTSSLAGNYVFVLNKS